MKIKKLINLSISTIICFSILTGCNNMSSSAQADLSYTQSDIKTISVSSDIRVVGLGEASHGVSQYHQTKADVFKALVENNNCRTFIIEGDFGGALKVDQYINGGSGTAKEAVSEIGFAIYRTQELADLVEWMRSYNESVSPKKTLHFYGMDVQRFDNNKEYLFSVIDQTHPELSTEYTEVFSQLTDENRLSLSQATLKSAKEEITNFIEKLDSIENDIVAQVGQSSFDFARECAKTLYACCDVQISSNYNATRDQYMYEKVDWFLQNGADTVLFINGHNGHIGKTSVATYTCLGELLSKNLGDAYYAIGTDSQKTSFNSQLDQGGFEVIEVNNTNDLNIQLTDNSQNFYFIDFATASQDEAWKEIINSKQSVTTLNVSLPNIAKLLKFTHTSTITPQEIFDGMIVFQEVTPSTILEK